MDVNVTADVKGHGVPSVQTVELEDAVKPSVSPVAESTDAVSVDLNDQALHGRQSEDNEKGDGEFSQEELEEVVEEIQGQFESMGSSFRFGLHKHEGTADIVAQLRDRSTDEIVKQFPAEEVLKLREKLKELVGLLFDEKV